MLTGELRLRAHLVALEFPIAAPGELHHSDLDVGGCDLYEIFEVGLFLQQLPDSARRGRWC